MNQKLLNWLDIIFQTGVILVVLVTPFLIWNLTTEFFETPKLLFLIAALGLLLLVWVLKFVVAGKVTITRTPLDLPLLALLITAIISTFLADSRYLSIFGNLPRVHSGLVALVIYVLLYFVIVSNLKKISLARSLVYLMLIVGTVLSVLSLLSYIGVQVLPLNLARGLNFTPTGASFSTTAILVMLLPFPLLSILREVKNDALSQAEENLISPFTSIKGQSSNLILVKIVLSLLVTLFAVTIILTGTLATHVGLIAVLLLAFFATPIANLKRNAIFLILPIFVAALVALLSFVKFTDSNILYTQAQNYPREIQLSVVTSWKVSASAFRDSPFWGSGPGTYLNNFTQYKPIDFNNSKFWNIRFDQAFNEYLHILATLGALGVIALIALTVVFVSLAFKTLGSQDNESLRASSSNNINLSLAVSGIAFFILLALHPSTLVMVVMGILILALFMAANNKHTEELQIGIAAAKNVDQQLHLRFDALPIFSLVLILGLVGASLYFTGKFALADYHHRQALQAVSENNGLAAYQSLQKAEALNSHIDLYHTDMAQINFALANAIARTKGPTEASPAGSLNDQDKTNIQNLLSQAIREGQVAVALNPNSAANWEVLGSIYRQITGVAQDALVFALDSYGRAIQKDPLNPLLRLNVGGIYYSIKNYDLAIRFFTDTVNLKPDYANGYYNLSLALREKGDLRGSLAAAERTVALLTPDSQDHKVASDLLSSLREKAKAIEATRSANLAPASQTNSALDNNDLPQVLDLPQPENIATPPAIPQREGNQQ